MALSKHRVLWWMRCNLLLALCGISFHAHSGNCLVQNGKKIGDCENVTVGAASPLKVTKSGTYSGNFSKVSIEPGVNVFISGNTDDVVVRSGATLHLSGNSDSVRVEGVAELSGNTGPVYVAKGGSVTIRGISASVSGPGRVVKVPGAIIGGVYITPTESSQRKP